MLVLRCYGFCTVLNSPRWLVSVGVKGESPADWLPGRPGRRSEGEARARAGEQESATQSRLVF